MSNHSQDPKLEKKYSGEMTNGLQRTANRAMLRAIGFEDQDFEKPLVGLASAGAELSPCNNSPR
jgi:dihydroxy-acid dehydratase